MLILLVIDNLKMSLLIWFLSYSLIAYGQSHWSHLYGDAVNTELQGQLIWFLSYSPIAYAQSHCSHLYFHVFLSYIWHSQRAGQEVALSLTQSGTQTPFPPRVWSLFLPELVSGAWHCGYEWSWMARTQSKVLIIN